MALEAEDYIVIGGKLFLANLLGGFAAFLALAVLGFLWNITFGAVLPAGAGAAGLLAGVLGFFIGLAVWLGVMGWVANRLWDWT